MLQSTHTKDSQRQRRGAYRTCAKRLFSTTPGRAKLEAKQDAQSQATCRGGSAQRFEAGPEPVNPPSRELVTRELMWVP